MTSINYQNLINEIALLQENADIFFSDKHTEKSSRKLRAHSQICIKLLRELRKDVMTIKTQRISNKKADTTKS